MPAVSTEHTSGMTNKSGMQRTAHVPALDGIRAIAVLWVLAFHFCSSDYAQAGPVLRIVVDVIQLGWIGVILFFSLSGFLITGILVDSRTDHRFFQRFYMRRTLRIFPLYYGVLFLLFALSGPLQIDWFHRAWVYLIYGQNYLAAGYDIPSSPYLLLRHFWTLAIEEQFYLVWPFLVYFIRDRRWLIATAALLASGAVWLRYAAPAWGFNQSQVRGWTPAMLDSLLLGAIAAIVLRTRLREQMLRVAPVSLTLAVAAFLLLLRSRPSVAWETDRPIFVWGILILSLAATSVVLCAMREGSIVARLCSLRGMRFLGKYSYGIYMLHYFLLEPSIPVRRAIFSVVHSKAAAVALSAILMSALSVLIAYASFHLFEKHFLRLKRYFEYDRSAQPHWKDLELPPRAS
jgi:peptidoglycan/LPS O-acetylase OafA/YrhL